GFASDAINVEYLNLRNSTYKYLKTNKKDTPTKNEEETRILLRRSLFFNAWSIINHGDILRQTLIYISKNIETDIIKSFLERHSTLRDLRNYFTHISSNIENIANTKKRQMFVYG